MNKKVKELIEATGIWVGICMKQYPDSRFVDDKLVRVCAALSAFEDKDWIIEATAMFHQYRRESEKNRDVKELCLIHVGKAVALHELLEKFGVEPKETSDETPPTHSATEKAEEILAESTNWEMKEEGRSTPLPCPFCGKDPSMVIRDPEIGIGICGKIACINPLCCAQPEICDDRRDKLSKDPTEDSRAYKATLISIWNKRTEC